MAPGRSTREAPRVAAQQEFAALTTLMRRVATAFKDTTDPLERAQLASELRSLRVEIDTFIRRHDRHLADRARRYLAEASLQVEIKLTAMAAQAARLGRAMPRRAR